MQANGGLGTFEACKTKPINTVLSGPIGGVIGAAFISSLIECKNVISLDMGGTSCDLSLIKDHRAGATTSMMIGNVPIKIPIIDLNTVGAGGGSIAWIDKGSVLKVGPKSAGSNPGPACYSKGGDEPTVTDANVVMGRIDPDYFWAEK